MIKLKKIFKFYLCVAIPVTWLFGMILYYGVNVPFWDEWEPIKLFLSFQQNGFEAGKLFAQHNEHRIIFPKIILLLSGMISNWNLKVHMMISGFMLASIYYITLKWFINSKSNLTVWDKYFFPLLVGFILFNPVQYENFLWGFQITFVMVAFGAVYSFYFYDKYQRTKKKVYFLLMLIFAFVASFSSMQGLAIWLVYAVTMLIKLIIKMHLDLKAAVAGIITAIGTWILYFVNYHKLEYNYKMFDGGIVQLTKFFFVNVGGIVLCQNLKLSFAAGIIIFFLSLALFVYLFLKKHIEDNWFPICLIVYGYGVIAMTSIGRSGLGIGFTSRYSTYTLLLIIGMVLIFLREYFGLLSFAKKVRALFPLSASCIIILGFILSQNYGMQNTLKSVKVYRQELQMVLENYEILSLTDLNKLYPWATMENARQDINILKTNSFSIFNGSIKRINTGKKTQFCIDQIGGNAVGYGLQKTKFINIVGKDKINISGWAVDTFNKDAPEAVIFMVNNQGFLGLCSLREDVAKQLGNSKMKLCGYNINIPQEYFTEGLNECEVRVLSKYNEVVYIMPVQIEIKREG